VIHGVAGSGKTLILAYRCQFLARTLTKPILVLVFNKALAAWLQFQMAQRGLSQNVTVRHFHGWCMDQLRHYHVPSPPQGPDFVAKLVEAVIRGVDRNQIPRAQYGAVLIDEGHDFEPDWLRLVVQMLDPESNSLLLLYDDAQSIYQHQRERFTFRSVGISAMGRTKILKRNYRNTDEILACASAFAGALLHEVQADDDTVPLVSPEPGGRKGPKPVFRELRSMQDEADSIAREIGKRRKAGTAFSDIGVFYTAPFVATEVMASLTRAGIPFEWLKDPNAKSWQPGHDSVKLMTIHSSKGLQYQVGIIAGAGCLPWRSPAEDARLMYVAMTRATHELLITGSKRTVFTERLREICEVQAA
jgi:superfamily I DNA/RNA helicase